jgi:hypothetical protein
MRINRIDGHTATEVAKVDTYKDARAYLARIGRVLFFDLDTAAGGADALIQPHGSRFTQQFAIEVL